MLVLGRKTAREKMASLITIIARREAATTATVPRPGMIVMLPLTREAMADYLGLTLETVSRQDGAEARRGDPGRGQPATGAPELRPAGGRDGRRRRERAVRLVPVVTAWQGRRGSNPRPSVLETDALPTELHP